MNECLVAQFLLTVYICPHTTGENNVQNAES